MRSPDDLSTGHPEGIGTNVSLNLLREAAAALAGAWTLPEMLDSCARAVVRWLDVAFARVWVVSDDGNELVLEASAGMYTHLDGKHARIAVGAYKIGRIAAARAPHLSSDVQNDPEVTDHEWARAEGMVSFAGYPLVAGGELVGVLGMFSRELLDEEVLLVLESLADSLALGIRRHRTEERLRAEHEVVEFLHQISILIAEQHTLEHIVQLVTDVMTRMTDAQFGAFFYEEAAEGEKPRRECTVSGAARPDFNRSIRPMLDELVDATFKGAPAMRLADVSADTRLGSPVSGYGNRPSVRSYMAVPVRSRHGEVFGALVFGHSQPGVFSVQQQQIVEGTAVHAAVAIEGARLHEAEHRLAVALQRALLPLELPSTAGASVAARYEPASEIADIGGDWYDVVPLSDGRLSVTVGDVMGHDLPAAAVMGQMRDAVRLHTLAGHDPARALQLVEEFMDASGITALSTVLHGTYDPDSRMLDVVRAGHVPPVLVRATGEVEWLEHDTPAGAPLGAGMARELCRASLEIPPGARLVLMSDGLFERRGESLDVGMDRVAEALARCGRARPEEICDELLALVTGSRVRDDVVVLVLATPS